MTIDHLKYMVLMRHSGFSFGRVTMNRVSHWHCILFAILTLFSLPLFTGCNVPKDHLKTFNSHFERLDYENSALFAQKKIGRHKNPTGEDLLWALQLATVERLRQNYQKSTECFDKSEDMLKYYDEQSELGDAIGSTIASDNIVPYKGEEYDGVMVNTYKALNFMAEGNMDLARVEFNRALDRQRRAKEKFSKEINKLKAELQQKHQQNDFSKSNVENPKTRELYACRNNYRRRNQERYGMVIGHRPFHK